MNSKYVLKIGKDMDTHFHQLKSTVLKNLWSNYFEVVPPVDLIASYFFNL